jgi:hypothetical protein
LHERCPALNEWAPWLARFVTSVASVVAVADMDGALKKNGASDQKLEEFQQGRGDDLEQLTSASQARMKLESCAAALHHPLVMGDILQRLYDQGNEIKRAEEAKLGIVEFYQPIKRNPLVDRCIENRC